MTLDQKTAGEIERDEAWLRETMPADPPVSLERTKHRVRIEVDHTWIEQHATVAPVADDLKGVKLAVRAEVERIAAETVVSPWASWRPARKFAGWAAAAVVVAAGIALYGPPRTHENGSRTVATLDVWIDALELDAPVSNDDPVDMTSLKAGLASLEVSIEEDEAYGWVERELDEVGDAIETLLTELG